MEEMPPSVSVTLNLSTSVCDSSGISSSTLKLVTDASSFLSVSSSNVISSDTNCVVNSESVIVALNGDAMEEDDVLSVGDETNLAIAEELLLNLPKNDQIAIILSDSITIPPQDLVLTSKDEGGAVVISQIPKEKPLRSVFEIDCVPLWGSVSLCGKRPEMEDAVAAKPRFLRIPIKMLIGDHAVGGLSQSLTHVTSHFYGVYDGHGGAQVANYCRDRLHFALAEQILDAKADSVDEPIGRRRQVQWERTFTNCFQRVDDEIGGKVGRGITEDGDSSSSSLTCSEPLAPETVGSTAVVALVCSSHIIVANCGDSRAVLLRGKESMALSIDHKPDSESEYSRIEAAGGKVIQWNGYRVFGVLAMSRSIGDRYLKPWIIPEPEVMFIPRARDDECLVIASDGLWDVMSNEEACEVARKRILVWHKKNGNTPSLMADRGQGVDPASQSAAEFLAKLATEKGSKDNISVIVVDLKAQRKFKTKS